jgi:hypothetical protein
VHAPTEDKSDDRKDSYYKDLEHVFDQFLKYYMKMLLGDFNEEVGKEDIFKLTIGNENFTSPDGKTCNQTDHILIDKRWRSNMVDVQVF